MGKSRQSSNQPANTFKTNTGNNVPLNGYPKEVLEDVQGAVDKWIDWGGIGIERRFPNYEYNNPDQNDVLNYVLDSMETTTEPLYRVEKMSRTFIKQNLEVGKYFNFKDKIKEVESYRGDTARLKSFSKTIKGSEYIMNEWYKNNKEELVLFRTNGSIKYFDASKWNNSYPQEEEVWVGSTWGKDWKVMDISTEKVNGRDVTVIDIS